MLERALLLPLLSLVTLACLPFENGQPAKGYTWGQPPLRICVTTESPAYSAAREGAAVQAFEQSVDSAARLFDDVPGVDLDCVDASVGITFYYTTDSLSKDIEDYYAELPPLGIFDVNGEGCPGLWATAGVGPLYGRTPQVSPRCSGTIARSVIYWPSMGPMIDGFAACTIWRSLGILLPCSEPFDSVVQWLRVRYGLPQEA